MKTAWKWGGWTILQAGLVVCLAAGAWAADRDYYGSQYGEPRALQPIVDEGEFTMDQQDPPPPATAGQKSAVVKGEKAPVADSKPMAASVAGCEECDSCCNSCRRCWFDIEDIDECCPYWTATGGAMILHRSGSRNYVVGDGPFTSGDFDLGWGSGARIELARHYQNWDLEFVYWGVESWSDEQTRFTQLLPPIRETATYDSRLYNFEWNLKRKYEALSVFGGFRYMELLEKLYNEERGLLLSNFEQREAANYLYGFQLGLGADFIHSDRISMDGFLKAGVFNNHIHEFASIGTGPIVLHRDATRDETAFLGEVGLNAKVRITNRLTAYGGYEVMWLDGVVLAPDTLGAPRLAHTTTNTPLYHGANFGLEFRW
jgi:hypothetical protein